MSRRLFREMATTGLPARRARDIEGGLLAERFRCGDSRAFDDLYRIYFDDVHRYLRMLIGDDGDAEDATQVTFLKMYNGLPRYQRSSSVFGAWVFTIARNTGYDHIRKRRSVPANPDALDALLERAATKTGEGDFDLLALVDALPGAEREVIVLRFLLGFSIAETAELIGRSRDGVSGIQYRALADLEQSLAVARHPSVRARAFRTSRRRRPLRAALSAPRA
jgi:RNA polymerase sigma-70 factor (ECF subfamily)